MEGVDGGFGIESTLTFCSYAWATYQENFRRLFSARRAIRLTNALDLHTPEEGLVATLRPLRRLLSTLCYLT